MVNSKSWLLTELSRETLKSYADRASSSLSHLPKKKMGKRAHSVVRTNTKLMTQEANDLTELSASTLGRYIKKSSDDEKARRAHGLEVQQNLKKTYGGNWGTPMDRKLYSPTASRDAGRNRALRKLTGASGVKIHATEENLQELSKSTLKRYINKSSDAADHINKGNEREGPDGKLRPDQERGPLRKAMDRFNTEDPQRHVVSKEISGLKKKLQNRRQGMITALRKMPDANEEVDLQELSSTKLRDYLVKANETEPKAKKHKKGIVKAFGRWIQQKESEELTELSKKTLLSYIDQSSGNAISRGRYLERDITKNNEHQWSHEADRDEKKIDKRHQGIMRAAKRLAKEDIDLQEVSKETLGRYITRSADNFAYSQKPRADYHRRKATQAYTHGKPMEIVNQDHDAADVHYRKADRRRQGIDLAVRKITKSKYAKVHAESKEDLKEVSKETLGRYITRATDSAIEHNTSANRLHRWANQDYAKGVDMKYIDSQRKTANIHADKRERRRDGIYTATKKLTNNRFVKVHAEAKEDLKEVARHTLMSYVRKAGEDIQNRKWGMTNGPSERKDSARKISRRVNGITLAAQKLGKNLLTVGPTKE